MTVHGAETQMKLYIWYMNFRVALLPWEHE